MLTVLPSPLGEKCSICGNLKSLGCYHQTKGMTAPAGQKTVTSENMPLLEACVKVLEKYQTSRGVVVSHEFAKQLYDECDTVVTRAKNALRNKPMADKPSPHPAANAIFTSGGSAGIAVFNQSLQQAQQQIHSHLGHVGAALGSIFGEY